MFKAHPVRVINSREGEYHRWNSCRRVDCLLLGWYTGYTGVCLKRVFACNGGVSHKVHWASIVFLDGRFNRQGKAECGGCHQIVHQTPSDFNRWATREHLKGSHRGGCRIDRATDGSQVAVGVTILVVVELMVVIEDDATGTPVMTAVT